MSADHRNVTAAPTHPDPVGDPGVSVPTGELFRQLAGVASRESRRIAVVDRTSELSYPELVQRAGEFCAALEVCGIGTGDRVALILGNSTEFLVAAFGVWKRGAILLPLNPQLQEPELLKYLLEVSPRGIVTTCRNASQLRTLEAAGALFDHAWLCPAEGNPWTYRAGEAGRARTVRESEKGASAASDWAAITQYSTGSTGHPKSVTRTHGQLLGEFHSVASVLNVTPGERLAAVTPFFHSHGLMNGAVLTLLSGGTLYVADHLLPQELARLLEREQICGIPGVPYLFQLLTEVRERRDFSSLRFALSAGAALPEETARQFCALYGAKIRQLYGSTETGVIAIADELAGIGAAGAVGLPIPQVSVAVVNERGQPVAPGVEGCVRVASPFAASRYDGAKESRESYFRGPYFFPGDTGRLSAAGELTLSGRRRGFINVSGNKVDPTEVETALSQLPGISAAVVFGVPDGAAGEKVKAVVVASGGVTQEDVRAHCIRRLAAFKHPRIIEFRKHLPKSPLGKILRKYLMDEAATSPRPKRAFETRLGFGVLGNDTASAHEPLEVSTLPAFLRVLLVTDGTVTRTLEAYFLEPIEVDILSHAVIESERGYPQIEVAPGDTVLRRHVVLRGGFTRSAYAFAESIIGANRMPPQLMDELVQKKKGIGELLCEYRLETHREVLGIWRHEAGARAVHLDVEKSEPVCSRSYKICHEGRAAMQIEEVFPEARFGVC